MSDYKSGLPIRSEADGVDERVHVKIVDGTNPAVNQTTVDSDKNLHVECHTNDPSGVDRVLRTSEVGALTPDGIYNVSTNTKPGNLGVITSQRNASTGDTTQTQRITGIAGSDGLTTSLDISLHDASGNPFTEINPLYVTEVGTTGTAINDYATSAAVAAAASSNHDYTVTALKTLKLDQVIAAASGKIKMIVAIETGVATSVFTTKWVQFNSTASPNIQLNMRELVSVGAGVRVRVTITNLDNQAQDVYSTISGHEL